MDTTPPQKEHDTKQDKQKMNELKGCDYFTMWIEKRKDYLLACERFYDDVLGKQQKISVKIAKDTAQERRKASKQLEEKWRELHPNYSDLKLSEIGRMYFEEAKDRLKEQTYIRDKGQFRIVLDIVGDVLVDKCTAAYVKAKLKASGKRKVTLNSYIRTFKIIVHWAYVNDLTDNSRLLDKLVKYPDVSAREKIKDKFLEPEALDTLLDGMTEYHWNLLTRFMVLSGMRIGEVIALENENVDLKRREIRIMLNYVHSLKRTDTPKTFDSIRTIPIQMELVPVIQEIKRWSAERKILSKERNDIFFCNPDGKYIPYDTYEKYLRENSIRILGRKVTSHVMRHTFTSIMAAKGLSLEQISRQLGHSNSTITKEIYLHVINLQKQKDAEEIKYIKIFAH